MEGAKRNNRCSHECKGKINGEEQDEHEEMEKQEKQEEAIMRRIIMSVWWK